jgi:uncharacterized protein (DUF305 family)
MKKLLLLLVLVTLAAAAGCGGNDEATPTRSGSQTVSAGSVPFDRAFIDAMVPHHQAAIAMAQEAKDAGLSEPELVEIADSIIATQQSEIDQMLEWRAQWFGSNEPGAEAAALETLGMSASEAGMEHHGMNLSTAEDVDQAFAEMMIAHHEGAIRMAELAKEQANHDEVKNLADDIIAAQQAEIEVMDEHAHAMH